MKNTETTQMPAASDLSVSTGYHQTNREAHEEAAGMNLCEAFFEHSGIDPDAPYILSDNAEDGRGVSR